MKKHKRIAFFLCFVCFFTTACSKTNSILSPAHPTTITVWHYYNGPQQEAFSELVQEFNATEGAANGVQVEESSHGSVSELETRVLNAAQNKVGAGAMPNIFSAYADTVFTLDQLGKVADLSLYLTAAEQTAYLPQYLSEGDFTGDGTLKIFPVAKSTELLMLNATDWAVFAEATGAELSDLSTLEGLTKVAAQYYDWTDAQTPQIFGDGKAFFGRDAFANYMLVGALQLGTEVFAAENGVCTLNFKEETMRVLWDNYYVPIVAGWFAEENRFRSDDIKMGTIIACVASSSSATYFPTARLVSDTESYPIEMAVLQAPQFAQSAGYAVQQGAGMAVTQATEAEIAASVLFLQWFTQPERNILYAASSSYLPVSARANDPDFFFSILERTNASPAVSTTLCSALETVQNNTMYTPKAFAGGSKARSILNNSMSSLAHQNRAALLEQVAQGTPYEEALAALTSDTIFETWYADTYADLRTAISS